MKKRIFKISLIFNFLVLFSFLFNFSVFASSYDFVILGGNSIGIKIDTGVTVVGKYEVKTSHSKVKPWDESNIEVGDIITSFDHHKIFTNSDLLVNLKNYQKEEAVIELKRKGKIVETTIDVVKTKNDEKSIGLYIKDKIVGIGTLTYINPKTKKFASLAHGIYDEALKLGDAKGDVCSSYVEGIVKSKKEKPGEKRAVLVSDMIGIIEKNTEYGVFGKITNESVLKGKKITLAKKDDVKIGTAKIYTVVKGQKVDDFDILITSIQNQDKLGQKGLKYEVIDEDLLNMTGGIVQGMSGSPIVQDGKIVGAVSHVTLENPKVGYGMHIEFMKI